MCAHSSSITLKNTRTVCGEHVCLWITSKSSVRTSTRTWTLIPRCWHLSAESMDRMFWLLLFVRQRVSGNALFPKERSSHVEPHPVKPSQVGFASAKKFLQTPCPMLSKLARVGAAVVKLAPQTSRFAGVRGYTVVAKRVWAQPVVR
jgi:hypothetical protein